MHSVTTPSFTAPNASTPSPTPCVGDVAPDFTLATTAGTTITLSAFRDRKDVLLAFFPAAFTSTCTSELCAFSDDYAGFGSADVEVLPISVDAVDSLQEFKHKYEMSVELLSDFKREASAAYGVLWRDAFFANRAYFLIDRSGIVRWAHVEEHPGLRRENAEIFDAIRAMREQ
ncbi:MAG TPA: redoxin domain-containing protein [Gemmatimonas sp.]|nr:redoxin domain-containing protein [Gemmatimonas sp.]